MNKTIVLFDMDGTLTEPRQSFERSLRPALIKLADCAEIGIVSGSDYEYIREQMDLILNRSHIRYKTHLLPCNGTKHYTPPKNNRSDYELIYNKNMKDEIGFDNYNHLIINLLQRQVRFSHILPVLTGEFIQYRGSMVNWCPIGRGAGSSERKSFVDLDTSYSPSLREQESLSLSTDKSLTDLKLQFKIGGDTSFDIFPQGWDKTHSLKHFLNYDVWFVGDRCHDGGNDKELYDLLKPEGRAFETKNPDSTLEIIEKEILPHLEVKRKQ
jgi:phosphomannomutase